MYPSTTLVLSAYQAQSLNWTTLTSRSHIVIWVIYLDAYDPMYPRINKC